MANEKPNQSTVTVGTMTNSILQQNSPGASASVRVITNDEKTKVEEILKHVAALVDALPLSGDDKDEMKEDIQTAEQQLERKNPKAGIISTCLKAILQKLTAAATGALAAHAASGVQWAIDRITALLGGM